MIELWLNQKLSVAECGAIIGITSGRFYKVLDKLNLPRPKDRGDNL